MKYCKNYSILILLTILTGFISAKNDLASLDSLYKNTEESKAPEFSVERGFYESSFDLQITGSSDLDQIKYTLDGSDPSTSPNAMGHLSPATVKIEPGNVTLNGSKNPVVIVRACNITPGMTQSKSVTHSYIFVHKLGELSPENIKPGDKWPNPTRRGRKIDYGIDMAILNDSRYKNIFDDAMLAIPSISIATDLDNLFNTETGIYMNPTGDGIDWERPTSVELINPDGTKGFQINAGIRIRGGYSRVDPTPKHAFRLFFRSEYGKGKLKFPLFENEGVDEFDKVDLRTSQNYSWSYPGHIGEANIMIRDVFCRDLQREMGQPYTRSRFYHLYLDGAYWGLYQTQERTEARFAASYLGGTSDDYDVVKNSSGGIGATDGDTKSWQSVWNQCKTGFSTNANYFKLAGRNEDGSLNPTYKCLVDIDNLIDYMLDIFYTGNFDSPTSKFGGNANTNNFYCIYNRNNNDGYKFFVHDAEHTLRTTAGEGPGIGLYENRVNIYMNVTSFSGFHPQWLHYRLSDNAEYKLRFADHVYKHFFNEGVLTPAKLTSLFLSRAKEIELAIIGESARWGNTYLRPTATKDDTWQPAIDDIVDNYFPERTTIVLDQLKEVGLYPSINPPVFRHNEITFTGKYLKVNAGYTINIKNLNSGGSILYTTDNQDPRLIGGAVSGYANNIGNQGELVITSSIVLKARVLSGNEWSALHEIVVLCDNDEGAIKVTEINYHPAKQDTIDGDQFEFIELKNISSQPVNLSQASFKEGFQYTFPTGTIIPPGSFIVLASDSNMFKERYGFSPFGDYFGQLDNSGEKITLINAVNDTIFSVKYNNKSPWPDSADGGGVSLVTKDKDPANDLNDPDNWRTSYRINGSPGSDDVYTSIDSRGESVNEFALYQNYPNPFNPTTNFRFRIAKFGHVQLKIFDILGNEVAGLVNEKMGAGEYRIPFNAAHLASGVYFYQLKTNNFISTKKFILLK